MRRFRKAAALGLAALMAVGSVNFAGITTGAAGLPTTDGHDKYVNKNVFDVISSDTFGTKELESPLFDKTKGSSDITDLQVPTLAYDESSIGLVWQKPEKYDNVADYNVYINGKLAGTARENYKVNAAWAAKYMESFYDYYTTQGNSDVDMVNVDIHAYRATGLQPDTEYTFKVVAIDKDGKELGTPQEIKQKTTAKAEVLNIKDFGAEESEGYVTYNDEINEKIVKNTKAIQAAIDACPEGGKVVIPENTDGKVFVSGAVWLKSDMTLEVNGTLWASPNSDHFEIGFLMYPFYTDTRGWGLVNAMTSDESNPIKNVRVTGTGTLYGNGWKYGAGSTMYEDGYTSNKGKNTQAGDPTDTETWGLPRYMGGGNVNVFYQGIQSKDSAYKYLKNTGKYDDAKIESLRTATTAAEATAAANGISKDDLKFAYATRSSLLIMRNCENVYVGDITIENPSNHSVNILDSRNIATTNVKVFSYDGNNGDGLGYGCSQNVICWGNFTDTGDDNLGFGASVGMGARDSEIQTNSEVWMFDNFLREGHGGLAAGSHTGNGIQDVLFEDTVMNHIDMAFRFKSAPTNGGFIANITMRDCAVADTNQAWVLTTSYSDPNSASTTEFAEIGKFYNFASYNVSVYGVQYNTVQVLADVDPVSNPQKPWHTHSHLYFQDITFGNVGTNGGFKNKNGWESLIGCENSVFYNFKTVSYAKKAVDKKTDKTWNNMQYCKDIVFQGTTWDSVNNCTDKMQNMMSGITVKDSTVKAEVVPAVTEPDSGSTGGEGEETTVKAAWDAAAIAAATTTANGLTAHADANDANGGWKTATVAEADTTGEGAVWPVGTEYVVSGKTKAMDSDGKTQSKGTIPVSGCFLTYEAAEDGVLSIDQKTLATKRFYVVDSDGKVVVDYQNTNAKDTAAKYETLTAQVQAGKTYYIYANGATANILKITFATKTAGTAAPTAVQAQTAKASDGRQVKLSWNAVENGAEEVFYGVDTYVNGEKVDITDGITGTETIMDRLSSGVTYTFKVYVSEKGDNANSMSVTGQNKTLLGEVTVTVDGEKDTADIEAPENVTSELASAVYTHAQGTWTAISSSDARIRGYKIYANGKLVNTVYNYQIPKFATAETVSKQIGRLTPGTENTVEIVAFTDAGVEYKYPLAQITTLGSYDYKAPVFAENAKVTAEVKDNDVVLTWTAATDDTAVGGYRVYVDGTPVVPEGKDFNPVNGDYTTAETTYTVTGLDLTKDHTFTIQAGDTWWKAAQTMGTYDKMAGFNWTVEGISTTLSARYESDSAVTDASGANIAVAVKADAGVIPSGSQLKVTALGEGNAYDAVKKSFDNKKFSLLDIRLLDTEGNVIQPDGTVTVTISVPNGYDSAKTKVFYVAEDGSMEDVNAVYADGKMTFTVAHFSNYVIVDETVVKDNDNSNTGDDNQNNGNQNGGNQNNGGQNNGNQNGGNQNNGGQNNGNQSGDNQNNGGQNNGNQNSNNQNNSQNGGAVSDNTDTGVKTGDSFAMWFYVILMAAAAGFAGCLVIKKKKLEK